MNIPPAVLRVGVILAVICFLLSAYFWNLAKEKKQQKDKHTKPWIYDKTKRIQK